MEIAIIENNIVTNVIVAETLEIAEQVTGKECVECDGSFWIGWSRKGKNWVAPVIPTIEEVTE